MLLNSVHKIRHLFESTDSIYHQLTIYTVVPFQLVLEIVIRISVVDSVSTLCVISVKWTPYTVTAFTKCEYREGPSIYDVHKKSGFWLPALPLVDVNMRSTWKPIAVWKWLVQRPSRRIAEIRLYDCNLCKIVLLVIYITNLYHPKIATFFPSKVDILVKKTPTSLHEKKTGWCQWILVLMLCVDVQMGLDPSPPSTRIHLSLTPLQVDVINGWPHI